MLKGCALGPRLGGRTLGRQPAPPLRSHPSLTRTLISKAGSSHSGRPGSRLARLYMRPQGGSRGISLRCLTPCEAPELPGPPGCALLPATFPLPLSCKRSEAAIYGMQHFTSA
ncbi:hypothetical protein NDU88_001281 [Pleurodeles waltl]|uniref:Uncharacterized protein n=1 Tax=Pleurodeles waltl TaxID=8319 RepID=A0AAV7MJA0_PLEWA|nr:hypothetical protein NDU88_001281 [Pleurodeles waltl]